MGLFVGTYKPDGYNSQEELDRMALERLRDEEDMSLFPFNRETKRDAQCQCECECCAIRGEMEETQEHKDKLARAQLKLRIQGQVKLGKEAGNRHTDTTKILNDEGFDSKVRYTGNHKFTELDKIYSRYARHEFLVFMEDNAVVLFDTIHGGFCWDSIIRGPERNAWYAEAVDPQGPHVEIFDIFIPGATQIFVKEL